MRWVLAYCFLSFFRKGCSEMFPQWKHEVPWSEKRNMVIEQIPLLSYQLLPRYPRADQHSRFALKKITAFRETGNSCSNIKIRCQLFLSSRKNKFLLSFNASYKLARQGKLNKNGVPLSKIRSLYPPISHYHQLLAYIMMSTSSPWLCSKARSRCIHISQWR